MDNPNCNSITLESLFFNNIDGNPIEIASSIENELNHFVNTEIINVNSPNVVAVERKGLNLFHPYLKNILEIQSVSSINQHQQTNVFRFSRYSPIKKGKNNILLTDAITTGKEVELIIQNVSRHPYFHYLGLSNNGQGFSKVCGYLAMEDTLERLKNQYPNIIFKFFKTVNNAEDYMKEHNKLQYVYQNRMEPIDEEHPYIIFNIEPVIDVNTVKSIISSSIEMFYGSEYFVGENRLAIPTKRSFTYYFDCPNKIVEIIPKVKLNDVEIEKMALRFKFDQTRSQLRVMGLIMPHVLPQTKASSIKHLIFGTCNRSLTIKSCKHHPWKTKRRIYFINTACTSCIDQNVSNLLVEIFWTILNENKKFKQYRFIRVIS